MSNSLRSQPCKARLVPHLKSRIADLLRLWAAWQSGEEDCELGNLSEYGLCFDYVAPGTFADQREAYFRYQLSWGGPSDEFRFFVNPDLSVHRIEYWFLDWFDGAHRVLAGESEQLLTDLWQWFCEGGCAQEAIRRARS